MYNQESDNPVHSKQRSYLAPGIYFVSTPGHGYLYIEDIVLCEMRRRAPMLLIQSACYPHENARNDPHYFEEDCEWARVAIEFPEFFTPEQISAARRMMGRYETEILRRHDEHQEGKR